MKKNKSFEPNTIIFPLFPHPIYKETKQESWTEGFRKWKRGTL